MGPILRHTIASFETEARDWRIERRTATALLLLPFAGGALLAALLALYEPLYDFLLQEDSLVEWATALAFAATAGVSVVVSRRLWLRRLRPHATAYALFALVAFLAAGEEISWGQRLFGFDGPQVVQSANLQDELTLHNLTGVYRFYVLGQLLVGLYGSLGAWWVHRRKAGRPSLNACLFFPPRFLSSAFLLLAVYRIGREGPVPATRFGEWLELCVAAALAIFVSLNALRLRSEGGAHRPRS